MAKKNRSNNKQEPNEPKHTNQKPKNQLVTYFAIFVFGFLAGIAFTVFKTDIPTGGSTQAQSKDQAHQHDEETTQAMANLEAEVTANPENHEAWVRLGHLYFDANHPEQAIGAYTKSLELHEGDANLLTDLGVMYRRVNQPEKAIASFDEAIAKDASHMPSRFNKGIVLMYDLDDPAGAIESWENILKIDPKAKAGNGESIRDFIDRIKAEMDNKQ
ncbi:MAG: tetratricopeptide repeat protein [Desulfobulbaceae bacterium]|nr:tetratricopeptide repeat protein [Desulfobulbaceae bacterium]